MYKWWRQATFETAPKTPYHRYLNISGNFLNRLPIFFKKTLKK